MSQLVRALPNPIFPNQVLTCWRSVPCPGSTRVQDQVLFPHFHSTIYPADPLYRTTRSIEERTLVYFADNPDHLLEAYADSAEGIDRAGGFAVQVPPPFPVPSFPPIHDHDLLTGSWRSSDPKNRRRLPKRRRIPHSIILQIPRPTRRRRRRFPRYLGHYIHDPQHIPGPIHTRITVLYHLLPALFTPRTTPSGTMSLKAR